MKSLKLQQTQEAGSIFINEVKNIVSHGGGRNGRDPRAHDTWV